MRFSPEKDDPENVGLAHAIKLLEPIRAKHKGLSSSDLWILAAYVSLLKRDSVYGLAIRWPVSAILGLWSLWTVPLVSGGYAL